MLKDNQLIARLIAQEHQRKARLSQASAAALASGGNHGKNGAGAPPKQQKKAKPTKTITQKLGLRR